MDNLPDADEICTGLEKDKLSQVYYLFVLFVFCKLTVYYSAYFVCL